jgi:hypothetical protein
MDKQRLDKINRVEYALNRRKRDLEQVKVELEDCKTENTELEWSAYGCIGLVNGWGRKDVQRLHDKLIDEIEKLEKEFELL